MDFSVWDADKERHFEAQYPLHFCCRNGEAGKLRYLLSTGQYNPAVEDCYRKWSAPHYAAYFGNVDCLAELCNDGIFDNLLEWFKQSPLHLAAHGGNTLSIKLLLNRGANMNRQDYVGETPLHKCARNGSIECLNLLLAHNANPSTLSNEGKTAADVADACGNFEAARILRLRMESLIQARDFCGLSWSNGAVNGNCALACPLPQQPYQQDFINRKRVIECYDLDSTNTSPPVAKRWRPAVSGVTEVEQITGSETTSPLPVPVHANGDNGMCMSPPSGEQHYQMMDDDDEYSEAEPYMLEPYKSVLRVPLSPMCAVPSQQHQYF